MIDNDDILRRLVEAKEAGEPLNRVTLSKEEIEDYAIRGADPDIEPEDEAELNTEIAYLGPGDILAVLKRTKEVCEENCALVERILKKGIH